MKRKLNKFILMSSILFLSTSYAEASTANKTNQDKSSKKQISHHHHQCKKAKRQAAKHWSDPKFEAGPAVAKEEEKSPFSGYMTLASNYMFRGVSQTSNLPAVQGSLTYSLPMGLYLNMFASNVNMTAVDGSVATLEIDSVIGIANTIADNFTYNLGLVHYHYPKASIFNYNEFLSKFSFYFLTAELDYSTNVFNVHSPGTYYNGGVKFTLPVRILRIEDINLAATIGHYDLPAAAGPSYNDYSLTLSKDIKNYTLALQFTNTNHRFLNNAYDDFHLIGSVTANF